MTEEGRDVWRMSPFRYRRGYSDIGGDRVPAGMVQEKAKVTT